MEQGSAVSNNSSRSGQVAESDTSQLNSSGLPSSIITTSPPLKDHAWTHLGASLLIGKMAITTLTGIEDTLALIHECGANLARIESTLLPALRKLCASNTSEGESTRNATAGSSRTRENTGASELVLCQPIQGNIDPLTVLDPATHSVGVLHILAARAAHASALSDDATTLLPHISAFVQRFDAAQVQLAGDKVTQLAARFSGLADRITNPESALQLLQGLASRFITRPESITTLHPLLAYVSLKATVCTSRRKGALTYLTDRTPISVVCVLAKAISQDSTIRRSSNHATRPALDRRRHIRHTTRPL